MEDAFEKYKKENKNDVDHLIQWLKDSKVIEESKETEKKVRKLFDETVNKKKVQLEEFEMVIEKLAIMQKKRVAELQDQLVTETEGLLANLLAAAESAAQAVRNFVTGQPQE